MKETYDVGPDDAENVFQRLHNVTIGKQTMYMLLKSAFEFALVLSFISTTYVFEVCVDEIVAKPGKRENTCRFRCSLISLKNK